MYVGVLTMILGWVLCFPAWDLAAYGLVVAAGFHLFVVLYEEPALRRRFGHEYDQYRGQVGRWLPRLRRAEGPVHSSAARFRERRGFAARTGTAVMWRHGDTRGVLKTCSRDPRSGPAMARSMKMVDNYCQTADTESRRYLKP